LRGVGSVAQEVQDLVDNIANTAHRCVRDQIRVRVCVGQSILLRAPDIPSPAWISPAESN
jgi:hypothetical protein